MMKLTKRPQWSSLQEHCNHLHKTNAGLIENRSNFLSLAMKGLSFDSFYPYSTDSIKKIHADLVELATACDLSARIEDLFAGRPVNISENRPALHTDLRNINTKKPDIHNCLNKMRILSEKIRSKAWLGYTGKPIQSILHIGIGGSDLSQRLSCHALEHYADTDIDIHFVANIDPIEMENVLRKLNPETTLVIVASKSFSTQETQLNTDRALEWLNDERAIQQQVILITAYPEKIFQHYPFMTGKMSENILPVWDWVGGRYSIWSAMGLVLMIAIGFENFMEFLNGANAMDEHFKNTPFEENIPVMLALLGIWNINFLHCQTHAIIPYSQRLQHLPQHLQQLDMESNGKSMTIHGEPVDHATGAIIWGGIGSNSQHSFHQLLHQGTHRIPIDFIMIQHQEADLRTRWLNANCEAQIQVLSKNPNSFIHLITLDGLTPYSLGALIAMYEHKVFVQSQIWNINPFDQPGVEQGKVLARAIMLND